MNVAIYIRVSTDEQANEGFSIEAQKRRLISYADSQDWNIVETYVDDGYSAKDLNRPDMKRMIKGVELRLFDVVLVYRLDRMTRSTSDCDHLLKLFEKYDVRFQSATESFETRTATGRLFIRLVADIAQWERENIAERVRFGMEQMVHEGKRPGAKFPYGYDKEGVLISKEVKIIREIRSLYMSGFGYKSIALRLNLDKDKWRRGNEWSSSTIEYTLENPFYAGIIRFGSKKSDGTYENHKRDEKVSCIYGESEYPAIFTKEEYYEHKDRMKRKSNSGFSRKKDYWFSGVLRCGRCGSSMFGRLTTKRSRKNGEIVRTQYYICSKKHDGRSCNLPTFRQVHIEHLVMEYIENEVINHESLESEAKKENKENDEIKNEIYSIRNDIQKLRQRKKKWQYMRANDEISSDDLKERMSEENELEGELTSKLSGLEYNNLDKSRNIKQLINLHRLWKKSDDLEKKQIVYEIFSEIVVNTELNNIKGVKNKFFDAFIQDVHFN